MILVAIYWLLCFLAMIEFMIKKQMKRGPLFLILMFISAGFFPLVFLFYLFKKTKKN